MTFLEENKSPDTIKREEKENKKLENKLEEIPYLDDNLDNSNNNIEQNKFKNETKKEIIYIPDFKIDKYPDYPLKAKRLGYEGEIILKVYTDNNGKILDIIVEKSTGYEILDRAAIDAVKQWNFKKVIYFDGEEIVFKTKIVFKLD